MDTRLRTITPDNAATYDDWMFLARSADKRAKLCANLKPDLHKNARRVCRHYIGMARAAKKTTFSLLALAPANEKVVRISE
ncbi:MAG: hypothetical protein WAZ27_00915 [Minisyncoccia bacterium]